MSSQNSTDAIIVGAGIIGAAIALGLSRKGLKTLNVDALPAPGYGSTSHSSAVVRPFYSHVTAAAIAHEARHRWLAWAEYLEHEDPAGLARYTESGGLVLIRQGEDAAYEQNLAALDEVGVGYELLDEHGVASLYPGINLEAFGPPKPADDPDFGVPVPGRISGGIRIAGDIAALQGSTVIEDVQNAHVGFLANQLQALSPFMVTERLTIPLRLLSRVGSGKDLRCFHSKGIADDPRRWNSDGPDRGGRYRRRFDLCPRL